MLKLKCKKHPKYAGKVSPRCSCAACYDIWVIRRNCEVNRTVTIIESTPREHPYEAAAHDSHKDH